MWKPSLSVCVWFWRFFLTRRSLRHLRRGRNDYPVRAMWRALVAGVVLQHASMQSLLQELERNPALLEMCGFDPLPYQGVPVWGDERIKGLPGRALDVVRCEALQAGLSPPALLRASPTMMTGPAPASDPEQWYENLP